jgi:hypothetical protein
MPFEELETINRHNEPPMASLSYLRHVRKGNEVDRDKIKPRLIVTLPTVICISQKRHFKIMVGTGEDVGKVRIIGVDDKTATPATDFKSYLVLRFGHVPTLGAMRFGMVSTVPCRASAMMFMTCRCRCIFSGRRRSARSVTKSRKSDNYCPDENQDAKVHPLNGRFARKPPSHRESPIPPRD